MNDTIQIENIYNYRWYYVICSYVHGNGELKFQPKDAGTAAGRRSKEPGAAGAAGAAQAETGTGQFGPGDLHIWDGFEMVLDWFLDDSYFLEEEPSSIIQLESF